MAHDETQAAKRRRLKVRKGDNVVVVTGRDKGKSGSILRVMPEENRVVVQGVNMVKRHMRPSAQQQGGIVEKEAPIHVSNVALTDPKDNKPTRVGYKFVDGRRLRFARRSGEMIDR
jgi:large subunit ribosomal protein L24